MRIGYVFCVILLLANCNSGNPPSPVPSHSLGYKMGFSDATAGNVVKDDEALVEWSGSTDIDRADYLEGYRDGQASLCHIERVIDWGKMGKNFPASCDGVANAEHLRQLWQQQFELR